MAMNADVRRTKARLLEEVVKLQIEDSHQEGRHKFSEENLNAQTLNFRREMYKIVDANPVA